MFKCISYKTGKYSVLDTSDGVIEEFSKSDIIFILLSGIEIEGLKLPRYKK